MMDLMKFEPPSSPYPFRQPFHHSLDHDSPFYCSRCDRIFSDNIAQLQHIKYSKKHHVCCNQDFETASDLHNHYINSSEHSYCAACGLLFEERGRGRLYMHHIRNSPQQHYYCEPCQFELETPKLLEEHLEMEHFACVRCEKFCGDEEKLDVHKQISERHWICDQCFRDFEAESQLLQHQKTHLPRNISCPGCDFGFCSNSALIIHWENGHCLGSRCLLNQYVQEFDKNGSLVPIASRTAMLQNEQRPKRASESDWNDSESNWNGRAGKWECPLQCSRQFNSSTALDLHLASPFHDALAFRCQGCALEGNESRFTALSGLMQHVEDTGCGNGGKGERARMLMGYLSSTISC